MIAEFIGLLIIVMAVWTQRVEAPQMDARAGLDRAGGGRRPGHSRRHYRAEFSAVVDLHRPRHAGADDLLHRGCDGVVHQPQLAAGRSRPFAERDLAPSTPTLAALAAACVWVQLILGAAFRHSGMKLLPHLIGACVVTAMRLLDDRSRADALRQGRHLRKPAQLLLALLMVQLGLGFCALPHAPALGPRRACSRWQHGGQHRVPRRRRRAGAGTAVVLAIQTRRMINVHAARSGSPRRIAKGRHRMSSATPAAGRAARKDLPRSLATIPSLIKARVTTLIVMTAWAARISPPPSRACRRCRGRCCTR